MRCRNRLWKPDRPQPKKKNVYLPTIPNDRDNRSYYVWRDSILIRDHHKCVLCGCKEWIQVHHIERWADNIERRYDQTNGVCLCIPCHDKHHGPEKKPFPVQITEQLQKYINTLTG